MYNDFIDFISDRNIDYSRIVETGIDRRSSERDFDSVYDYEIKLPKFAFESKEYYPLIMDQLNNCYLSYKRKYNIEPDVCTFHGKYGKKIHDSMKSIFSSMFEFNYVQDSNDYVVFSSSSEPTKKKVTGIDGKPIIKNQSLDGMVIKGTKLPSMGDIMSSYLGFGSGVTIEREIETSATFYITII